MEPIFFRCLPLALGLILVACNGRIMDPETGADPGNPWIRYSIHDDDGSKVGEIRLQVWSHSGFTNGRYRLTGFGLDPKAPDGHPDFPSQDCLYSDSNAFEPVSGTYVFERNGMLLILGNHGAGGLLIKDSEEQAGQGSVYSLHFLDKVPR